MKLSKILVLSIAAISLGACGGSQSTTTGTVPTSEQPTSVTPTSEEPTSITPTSETSESKEYKEVTFDEMLEKVKTLPESPFVKAGGTYFMEGTMYMDPPGTRDEIAPTTVTLDLEKDSDGWKATKEAVYPNASKEVAETINSGKLTVDAIKSMKEEVPGSTVVGHFYVKDAFYKATVKTTITEGGSSSVIDGVTEWNEYGDMFFMEAHMSMHSQSEELIYDHQIHNIINVDYIAEN